MTSKVEIQPLKRTNIYEDVIRHLKDHIVANKLSPGDRLPTEAELAESFSVSRLSVREALKVMESLGIVQSRTRDGTRLQAWTMKPVTDHVRFLLDVEQVPLEEIAVARQSIECSMMPLIVANADESDFERIAAAVGAMGAVVTGRNTSFDHIAEADSEFHLALLASTHNRAIESFGAMLQEFFQQLRTNLFVGNDDYESSVEEHRLMYLALLEGNADKATQIMRQHLNVYSRFPFAPDSSSQKGRTREKRSS
jgi:GntR family transcriptional repressor for pyruvate dehydrogenase complex